MAQLYTIITRRQQADCIYAASTPRRRTEADTTIRIIGPPPLRPIPPYVVSSCGGCASLTHARHQNATPEPERASFKVLPRVRLRQPQRPSYTHVQTQKKKQFHGSFGATAGMMVICMCASAMNAGHTAEPSKMLTKPTISHRAHRTHFANYWNVCVCVCACVCASKFNAFKCVWGMCAPCAHRRTANAVSKLES